MNEEVSHIEGPSRHHTVAAMTRAERARTVVAAGSHLPWSIGDDLVVAPYFEIDGAPVLLTRRDDAERLLAAGHTTVQLNPLPGLGVVLLAGRVRPVDLGPGAPNAQRLVDAARHYREQHVDCRDTCGAIGSDLIQVVLDRVMITGPDNYAFVPVDLDAYEDTEPDEVIAQGAAVAEHLTESHAEDVAVLAAMMLEVPVVSVLAASVDWIDRLGIDISVIDVTGSQPLRAHFDRPLSCVQDLGRELHAMLHDPASHLRTTRPTADS